MFTRTLLSFAIVASVTHVFAAPSLAPFIAPRADSSNSTNLPDCNTGHSRASDSTADLISSLENIRSSIASNRNATDILESAESDIRSTLLALDIVQNASAGLLATPPTQNVTSTIKIITSLIFSIDVDINALRHLDEVVKDKDVASAARVADDGFSHWEQDVVVAVAACGGTLTDGSVSTTTLGSSSQVTQTSISGPTGPTKQASGVLSDQLGRPSLMWLLTALPTLSYLSLL